MQEFKNVLGADKNDVPIYIPGVGEKAEQASPKPSVTPQPKITQVAAKPLASPKPPKQTTKKATIWNPNTGEKKVVNVGEQVPQGWSLWTGGTASGEEARQAIFKKQSNQRLIDSGVPFGMSPDEATKLGYDPNRKSREDIAANALEVSESAATGEVVDKTPSETQPAENKYEIPQISDILSSFGIQKMEVPDFTPEYENLDKWRDNQYDAIDLKYQELMDEQRKKNENLTANLKAKLIKAGVNIDGTSFDSAIASQEARNEQALQALERQKALEKAAVTNQHYKNYLNLKKEERDAAFNANVQNINNLFKGYNLATSIWDSFSRRSEAERKAEQDAQEHLDKMNLEWAKLDQNQRADDLQRLQELVTGGYIDIMNDNNIELLHNLERKNGLAPGELTEPAISGYWNRMSNIALKDAQTQSMISSTKERETLLPLKKKKYEKEISKIQADINKALSSKGTTGVDTNRLLQGAAEKLRAEALGPDKYYDSRKYVSTMNEFIQTVDPKLKNEKYYKELFLNYFPPTKLLNPSEEDKTAAKLRGEYTKKMDLADLLAAG